MKRFTGFCNKSINIIFGAFILWLFMLCLLVTCYMNSEEHTYFVMHSPATNILMVLVILGVAGFMSRISRTNIELEFITKYEGLIKWILLVAILIECMVLVLGSNATPVSDQLEVLNSAKKLMEGDFTPFMKGGYIYMYSIQSGLVVFYSFLLKVFSLEGTITFFQILSAVGITFTYKLLYEISNEFGLPTLGSLLILCWGIIFIPYNIYAVFVYGTVLGFVCALAAIKWEIWFLRTHKIGDGIFSAFFLLLSLVFKPNYLIFFVGMAIAVAVAIFNDGKKNIVQRIVYIIVLAMCYLMATTGPKRIIANISGCELNNPMASIAWLEMGLQDGPRAEGWYNAYNANTYEASGFDGKIQGVVVKDDLTTSLENIIVHKKDAIRFFTKKTASQWLNPTFESFWSVQQMGGADKRATIVNKLLQASTINKLTSLYSFLELYILFGTVLFVFAHKEVDDGGVSKFIYEIIFIGGFVFYMFWEAKGQYTIVYFMILIPFATAGYDSFIKWINGIGRDKLSIKNGVKCEWIVNACLVFLSVMIFATSVRCLYVADEIGVYYWDNDNVEFANYRDFFDKADENGQNYSGECKISPFTSESLGLANSGEDVNFSDDITQKVIVNPIGAAYRICFSNDNRYLSIYRNADGGYNTEAAVLHDLDGEYWRFEETGDGQTVYIYNSTGYGLAYNADGQYAYMTNRSDSESQKWVIER